MKKRGVSLVLALLIICMPIGYSSDALFSKVDVPRVGVEKDSERVSSEGLTRYVYGSDMVASVKDSEIKYYHSDRIQSNRLVTDSSGSVENEFKSLPFGQKVSNSGVRYAFATGKELDESDLYYFGARYYDSNIGRFTSVDPVKENEPYSYVRNNPMNLVDPTGMDPEEEEEEETIPCVQCHGSGIDFDKEFSDDGLGEDYLKNFEHNLRAIVLAYIDLNGLPKYYEAVGNSPGYWHWGAIGNNAFLPDKLKNTVIAHINTAFKIVNDKKRYNNFHFVIDPRYPDLIRQSLVRIRNTFSPSGNTRMSGLYVAEGITLLRGLELMVTLATPGLFIVGGAISTDATIKYMSAQSPEENAVFIEAMSGKM